MRIRHPRDLVTSRRGNQAGQPAQPVQTMSSMRNPGPDRLADTQSILDPKLSTHWDNHERQQR